MRNLFFVTIALFANVAFGADPPLKSTPAEDLKSLQGEWTISKVFFPNHHSGLPSESRLTEERIQLVFDGNTILHQGKVVAKLENDLPLARQHDEIGWRESNRLIRLTLPGGREFWCSYGFRDDRLQLTHPHTASCHRGSGQIIYLVRSPNPMVVHPNRREN